MKPKPRTAYAVCYGYEWDRHVACDIAWTAADAERHMTQANLDPKRDAEMGATVMRVEIREVPKGGAQ